uniref:Uncharacterized protein n=1 Tax=Streptomyces sp. NBC_00049 TaxID=2903617 RepID=A0AAU2JWU5_9ACTN
MEELAYVATKMARGIAGLAYVFGDSLMSVGGPDAANQPPRPDKATDGNKGEDSGESKGEADGTR